MPVLLYSISKAWNINLFLPGKKVVHKMCIKVFFVLKIKKLEKLNPFFPRKKYNEKSSTFFYNLPYESYEKSPVMKLNV